ncbi:hypothetical protein GQ54DRAFT_209623 [Martensiomyces pterosporus]|nr:hypothetical protein GQ54DRAFT_209623 [Martensiomyces pterosporus]
MHSPKPTACQLYSSSSSGACFEAMRSANGPHASRFIAIDLLCIKPTFPTFMHDETTTIAAAAAAAVATASSDVQSASPTQKARLHFFGC